MGKPTYTMVSPSCVSIRKLTDISLTQEMLSVSYGIDSTMSLETLYHRDHSIARTQLFLVKMVGIKSKVSVHLVRHSGVGQLHLVGSNRGDWNGKDDIADWDEKVNRGTPVNHTMLLNADHLRQMMSLRLCGAAEEDTRTLMEEIKIVLTTVDPELSKWCVPQCWHSGGFCKEVKTCHLIRGFREWNRTVRMIGR